MELAYTLASEIKDKYPLSGIEQIAAAEGATVKSEPPLDLGSFNRVSEYRPRSSEIVIFCQDKREEAVAHELFHHIESKRGIRLSRQMSEDAAKEFARFVIMN